VLGAFTFLLGYGSLIANVTLKKYNEYIDGIEKNIIIPNV
jgi:hypothetical protein